MIFQFLITAALLVHNPNQNKSSQAAHSHVLRTSILSR